MPADDKPLDFERIMKQCLDAEVMFNRNKPIKVKTDDREDELARTPKGFKRRLREHA